jgi:hypothetical protein
MAVSPKGLSDEKAARMMVALRQGRTLRLFGVKAQRLEAYFKAHPEYARAARPLILANSKAAFLRKGAHIRNKTHCINGHSFRDGSHTRRLIAQQFYKIQIGRLHGEVLDLGSPPSRKPPRGRSAFATRLRTSPVSAWSSLVSYLNPFPTRHQPKAFVCLKQERRHHSFEIVQLLVDWGRPR